VGGPRSGEGVKPEVVFSGDDDEPWYGDPEANVEGFGAVLYTLVLDHR